MRGYFGIGVEGLSKPMNAGSLFRTANAFGASFVFTVNAEMKVREANLADTSRSFKNLPYYDWATIDDMALPKGCPLVGVELIEGAVELPRFRHPKAATYVLGRERGSLTPEMLERCDHVLQIPTEFCVNVAIAGAIVMYDRLLSTTKFGDRPVVPRTPPINPPINPLTDSQEKINQDR